MLCNEELSVKQYVRLTDADINGVLMDWADHDDAVLSGYARRLVSRRDYHKSIRIGELTAEMSSVVIPKLLPIVEEAGFSDADIITASIRKKGYMPYSQGIVLEDGRDVVESSPSNSKPNSVIRTGFDIHPPRKLETNVRRLHVK